MVLCRSLSNIKIIHYMANGRITCRGKADHYFPALMITAEQIYFCFDNDKTKLINNKLFDPEEFDLDTQPFHDICNAIKHHMKIIL